MVPAVTVPKLEASRIVAADGAVLPLRHWPATGNGGGQHGATRKPRAVILALHGFGDYSGAFEDPAETWAAHGIETWAYDQRGFGDGPHRGRWAGDRPVCFGPRAWKNRRRAEERWPRANVSRRVGRRGGANRPGHVNNFHRNCESACTA